MFQVLQHLRSLASAECIQDRVECCVWSDALAGSVEQLEQCANTALIRALVRTFTTLSQPLQQLRTAAVTDVDVLVCDANKSPRSGLTDVESLVATFDQHVDAMFQVTSFAIACSADQSRACELRSSLLSLEWLEGCLVPALIRVHKLISKRERSSREVDGQYPVDSSSVSTSKLAAAEAHARVLVQHWEQSASTLRDTLYAMLEPAAFVMVCIILLS